MITSAGGKSEKRADKGIDAGTVISRIHFTPLLLGKTLSGASNFSDLRG
jgi:hypothetical protein